MKISEFENQLNAGTNSKSFRLFVLPFLVITVFLLDMLLLNLLVGNFILNTYIKNPLLSRINKSSDFNISIQNVKFNFITNSFHGENIRVTRNSRNGEDSIFYSSPEMSISGINWPGLIFYKKISIGNMRLSNASFFINHVTKKKRQQKNKDSTSASLLNSFRISELNIRSSNFVMKKNHLLMDSIFAGALDLTKINLSSKYLLDKKSIIRLRLPLLYHRFSDSKYELRLVNTQISSEENLLSIDSLAYRPFVSHKQFWAGLKTRETFFLFYINGTHFTDPDFNGFFEKEFIKISSITLENFYSEVTLNKGLPAGTEKPKMPNEILRDLKYKFQIDTINVRNGLLSYRELFPYSEEPAILDFSHFKLKMTGAQNYSPSVETFLDASANLVRKAKLTLKLKMPLASKKFQFSYEGRLDSMVLQELNTWLVISDLSRITSGNVKYASYNVNVIDTVADGNLDAVYNDLKITRLNEDLKSGILEKIKTCIGNTFIIESSNPDNSGKKREIKIHRVIAKDEAFFQLLWLNLRLGIKQVIGLE